VRRADDLNGVKNFLKSRAWTKILMVVALVSVVLALATRKSALIAYHRHAMVGIWQTALGLSPRKSMAEYDEPTSPSKVLGLTVYATPEDMAQWEHFVTSIERRR